MSFLTQAELASEMVKVLPLLAAVMEVVRSLIDSRSAWSSVFVGVAEKTISVSFWWEGEPGLAPSRSIERAWATPQGLRKAALPFLDCKRTGKNIQSRE